jgi:integrase
MAKIGRSNDRRNTPVALTDAKIKGLKPRKAMYKVFDTGRTGLHIVVNTSGSKLWRMRYWFDGKEKTYSIGKYPYVSLSEAREKVFEARKLLAHDVDPTAERKAEKIQARAAENTFKAVALEWFEKRASGWSEGYADMVRDRLEKQLFPWLADRPMGEITAPELLAVLRRIESRGALEVAHRCLQHASSVFRYAVACGLAERDPASDLRGALTPVKVKHLAAITTPIAVGELLRAIDSFSGTLIVASALRISPLLFVRPGELRQMEWSEIDFENGEWRLPAAKMKARVPHVVPLSRQAIGILKGLEPLTGRGRYVFPSERTSDRPMSENAVLAALRRLGYSKGEMTGHGFRAMATSLLNELGFKPDVIELQLAHKERGVRAAYHRAEYLNERRQMMQSWADYLDDLKAGGKVIAIRGAKS